MANHSLILKAQEELKRNQEQYDAVHERGHCVVLAGPGSGKTKTLTTAIARVLLEDIIDPRGIACITYSHECAIELEMRLEKLGVISGDRNFIGTVHSFALTQVIIPYARCISGLLPNDFRVATSSEKENVIASVYSHLYNNGGNPKNQWQFAEEKRRKEVDRSLPSWRGRNIELAQFIEAYEIELRRRGLIDFDDMPLIAFRMIKDHKWIRDALYARFPILFVDEYQDLGHALHELVLLLCFEGNIRLFAVGDADQSIYGFTGANPELLQSLTRKENVRTIQLRFNYRSGLKIIEASIAALGEERNYCGVDDAQDGEIFFHPVNGSYDLQAKFIANNVLPKLLNSGIQLEEIAILYRAAWLGDNIERELKANGIAYQRSDANSLIKRNSKLARFIEACASWATGGWRNADPSYERILSQALIIVYGGYYSKVEEQLLSLQLINFLQSSINSNQTTHTWLLRFYHELIILWQPQCRNAHKEWETCLDLVQKTSPKNNLDMPLNIFAGRIAGSGRVTLSTLHSSKGREFDAVILFGVNNNDLPSKRDQENNRSLREARRLFYVGVTRPRHKLFFVYQYGRHSPWIAELYRSINTPKA